VQGSKVGDGESKADEEDHEKPYITATMDVTSLSSLRGSHVTQPCADVGEVCDQMRVRDGISAALFGNFSFSSRMTLSGKESTHRYRPRQRNDDGERHH
jgi:hypothetical protein